MTVAEGDRLDGMQERANKALQWGRNLTVAEGFIDAANDGREHKLQWGRNLTVAEGSTAWSGRSRSAGFNGAAT